jgi:hypothetical protein
VTYSGSGVLNYSVSDGGKVGSGTVIAQVYADDEQIKINREIASLQRELDVLSKIENPGTVESAQPIELSADIEETYRNLIYYRDMGDYDNIASDMEDFLVQMSTYQIVTGEGIDFAPRISDINSRLAELNSESVSPEETITSDTSAYFVSFCDGYEDKLTKETASSLTIEQIKGVSDTRLDTDGVAGKLIDGYEWYMTGIIDNSRKDYSVGEKVSLKFRYDSETYSAEIIDLRDEGDPSETIVLLSSDEFNSSLVQHRCETVELIKGEYTGLKVPREAIRFKAIEENVTDDTTDETTTVTTNYKGVYILSGEQVSFKKIDVIYEGSDYVLSAVHDGDSSYLALYDDILTEGDE